MEIIELNLLVVVKKLQEDAEGILQFMASNGLVANPTKTEFVILNNNRKKEEEEEPLKIRASYHHFYSLYRIIVIPTEGGSSTTFVDKGYLFTLRWLHFPTCNLPR